MTNSFKAPKVLHVCKVYLPVKGGVQRVVKLITEQLDNFNHTILTTGEDGAIWEQQLDHARVLRCRSYAQIASLPIAPSIITRLSASFKKYDLIAIHYPFPLADAGLLLCFGRTPCIIHWHSNIVAQRYLRWLVAPFSLLMFLRSSAIVVTDPSMIENSLWLRLFKRKCRIIPYGIEAPSNDDNQFDTPPYLVLVGRHVSYKGMDVALRALLYCDTEIKIIGDGPLFNRHQQLALDLGIANRVEFVRYANDNEVNRFIAASAGLVVASNLESEAFALVQLEAMRLGKPVINTALKSAVPTVARHELEAITVMPNDPQQLGLAMQKLVDDRDLAIRLGQAARTRFHAKYHAHTFRDALSKLYLSISKKQLG